MNETASAQCRRCGAPLHGGVPGGLCAACFGGGLFASEPEGLPFTRIGDYELLEEIGRGGMGLVYRARQVSVNRPVAVKLILTGPLASALERQRFVAEASAAAALDHAGIVAVYEAGEEDGQPFFAMQLIEGQSLSARLGHAPRFAPREAAELIRRTALAIQHAHERGFLHRDLKPGNILLDAQGAPHVTDFGLARRMDDESHLTLTGAAVGTPSYMAPEQTDTRRPPTTAVDVYSLGAILYEVLSGRPPFAEKSLPELFVAIREKEPASISAIRSEVDRDLDIICRKCLEKEPARRYRTAQALADDLQHWLNGEPISARAAGKMERLCRWCRRRPAVAGLAAAAAIFFVAGLAGILWQWNRANREASGAVAALGRAEEALWQANVSEARARRISRERGQRTGSLAALARAAAWRPTMELRNEAIAALALPDLGEPVPLPDIPANVRDLRADGAFRQFAWLDGSRLNFMPADSAGREPKPLLSGVRLWSPTPDFSRVFAVGGADEKGLHQGLLLKLPEESHSPILSGLAPGAAFLAGGQRLVIWREGKLEVVNADTHEALDSAAFSLRPELIVPSPDETKIAVFQGTRGEIWSLKPLAPLRKVPALPDGLTSLVWQPDGWSLVAGAASRGREAWTILPELNEWRVLARHDREGVYACVHPTGLFTATIAWDGVLQFSHPALNDPLLRTAGVRICQFSADGRSLLVTASGRAAVCRVTPPDVWRCMPVRSDESLDLRALRFSPDGRWLAAVSARSLVVWNVETLEMAGPVALEEGQDAAFTGGGDLLALDYARGPMPVRLAPAAGGSLTLTAQPPRRLESGGRGMVVSPDGTRIFTPGRECAVHDAATGKTVLSWRGESMTANGAWSPDGRWLAAGYWNNSSSSGSEACVWSAADGTLVKKLPAGNSAAFFTPDGRRLLVSATHECVEYETGTWRELRRHSREATGLDHGAVAFAADAGLMALMADESVVRLVDLNSGEEYARLTPPFPHKIATGGLALSNDGNWLACASGKSVRVWNLRLMRQQLRELGLDWDNRKD